jgi:hypothetical protein
MSFISSANNCSILSPPMASPELQLSSPQPQLSSPQPTIAIFTATTGNCPGTIEMYYLLKCHLLIYICYLLTTTAISWGTNAISTTTDISSATLSSPQPTNAIFAATTANCPGTTEIYYLLIINAISSFTSAISSLQLPSLGPQLPCLRPQLTSPQPHCHLLNQQLPSQRPRLPTAQPQLKCTISSS